MSGEQKEEQSWGDIQNSLEKCYDLMTDRTNVYGETHRDVEVIKRYRCPEGKNKNGWLRGIVDFFFSNWKYLTAFLFPLSFYFLVGVSDSGNEIVGAMATITAVAVAGCISMIVLQENKRLEELKLDEKLIFKIRERLHEFYNITKEHMQDIETTLMKAYGIDIRLDAFEKDFKNSVIIITDNGLESAQSIEEKIDQGVMKSFGALKKELEVMLRANPRANNALAKLKMLDSSISHCIHLGAKNNIVDARISLHVLRYLIFKGVDDLDVFISDFLDSEIKRSKRGGKEVRQNIKSFYIMVVMCLTMFVTYVYLSSYRSSESMGGLIYVFFN